MTVKSLIDLITIRWPDVPSDEDFFLDKIGVCLDSAFEGTFTKALLEEMRVSELEDLMQWIVPQVTSSELEDLLGNSLHSETTDRIVAKLLEKCEEKSPGFCDGLEKELTPHANTT